MIDKQIKEVQDKLLRVVENQYALKRDELNTLLLEARSLLDGAAEYNKMLHFAINSSMAAQALEQIHYAMSQNENDR